MVIAHYCKYELSTPTMYILIETCICDREILNSCIKVNTISSFKLSQSFDLIW